MSADEITRIQPRRRTLGRGLGSLLGEAKTDYAQLDSEGNARPSKTVAIDLLSPLPFQPRRYFNTEALEELASSIREKGVLQPIMVRRHPVEAGQYQIIAGERRWRASSIAGLHEVPIIIRDFNDSEALEVALIENVQRQDLNIIEEAEGYDRLVNEYNHTQEDVARLVGKSRVHVANTLRLLRLPENLRQHLRSGELTAGHARAILAAGEDEDLIERILSSGMSVREAEQQAQQIKLKKAIEKPGEKVKLRDANIVALENELSQTLGLKVSITGRGSAGTLTIKYQTLDQFDDLLHRLVGKRED